MTQPWTALGSQPTRLEHGLMLLRLLILSLVVALAVRATVARAEANHSTPVTPVAPGEKTDAIVDQTTRYSVSQLPEAEQGVRVTRDARGRKMQHVDFSDAVIEGKARTPDGFVIQSRTPGRFNSLVELPRDFRDNIYIHSLDSFWGIGVNSK